MVLRDLGTLRIGQINGQKYVSMVLFKSTKWLVFVTVSRALIYGLALRYWLFRGRIASVAKRGARKDTPLVIIADDGINCLGLVFINGLLS